MKKYLLMASLTFLFLGKALASFEVDRRYALETIGALRTWDNVDGVFGDYLTKVYEEYFSQQTRFRLQNLQKAEEVLSKSKLPYEKLISDTTVLSEVSKSYRVESLLITKVYKEGPRYRISIQWLHAPRMNLISKVEFVYNDQTQKDVILQEALKIEFSKALSQVIDRVPFRGHITGRDQQWITLNLGLVTGIRVGDQITVSTIEDVKSHPLLNTLEDWSLIETGKATVTEVSERIAFAKINKENPDQKISRYQKITKISPQQDVKVYREGAEPTVESGLSAQKQADILDERDRSLEKETIDQKPEYGWASGSIFLGNVSRQYTSPNSGVTGSGFLYGGRAEGQAWFTRAIFAGFSIGYGRFDYSQIYTTDEKPTPAAAQTATLMNYKIEAGYSFAFTSSFFGPKAHAKVGYRANDFSFALSNSEATGDISYDSLFLGVGGEIPLVEKISMKVDLGFGLINGETDKLLNAASSSSLDFSVFGAAVYHYKARLHFQLGVGLDLLGSDYTAALPGAVAPTTSVAQSISHTVFTVVPSVIYLF